MREVLLKSENEYLIKLKIYDVENPKAIIQVAHGMEEHQGRYENFALQLNKHGFTVVTADMRGHGENESILYYFGDKIGDKILVSDQKIICDFIHSEFKDKKVYLFAHSMGTIISRVVLQSYSQKYEKVILSGFQSFNPFLDFGIVFAQINKMIKGGKSKAVFMENLGLKIFNKPFRPIKTRADWQCSDEKVIEEYMADDLCGQYFPVSSYIALFKLMKRMHKWKDYSIVNSYLPIFMIYGQLDSSIGGEKGIKNSIDTLKKAGFKNITSKCYSNMRHEIINEINKEIVLHDIIKFFQ